MKVTRKQLRILIREMIKRESEELAIENELEENWEEDLVHGQEMADSNPELNIGWTKWK